MKKDSNLTIPNILTVLRILLTPGFVVAFLDNRLDLAWLLFAVAGFTDALDGFLARVLKQRTRLGSMLDPLADKVLLTTSYVCLSMVGMLPRWIAVMVVSRDIIIVGGLALIQFFGGEVRGRIMPSWLGKTTTLFQIGLVLFVMAERSLGVDYEAVRSFLMYSTAMLTGASGLDYIRAGFRLLPPLEPGDV
ncbi:MAG: CDP-diacylglycerol--glycerol-3-phosphate 3-phosphatidyltransferase [Desulfovibrionaceae bacterium]